LLLLLKRFAVLLAGMRAVKSVLVMAGGLKRANPELPEDVVLIRAMRDSNLPKFLTHDMELFCNIIADLFPGLNVPNQVSAAVECTAQSPSLYHVPPWPHAACCTQLQCCLQLHC
jgi:hypothetical protein